MFIWFVMGFIEYGPDIVDYHFDLRRTLQNFIDIINVDLSSIVKSIENFYKIFTTPLSSIGDFFTRIWDMINLTCEAVYEIGELLLDIIFSFFKLVFEPKFYKYR